MVDMKNFSEGNIRLIPDNTFYTLFIKNGKDKYLIKIIKNFITCISPLIKNEISNLREDFPPEIEKNLVEMPFGMDYFNLLKPIISKKEYEKGEFDVIVLAHACHDLMVDYLFILDDASAIRIVQNHFPELLKKHRRTGGFIIECYNKHKILNKDEVLDLIEIMDNSDFRISQNAIKELKDNLKNG